MKTGRLVGIAAVWVLSLVGVGLWAQGTAPGATRTTGHLTGTVQDAMGGALLDATVVLISESRGTRAVPGISSASGRYAFQDVPADTYTIEVNMPGFRTLRRSGVAVTAGDVVTVPALVMQASQEPRIVRPGETMGPIISGDDIGFQPVFSPHAPAGAISGRWMVRIDGEWRVATGVVQTVPLR